MVLLEWTKDYSVGVNGMDNQHKKLFDMLNQLHAAMSAGQGKSMTGPILKGLVDYTKTHFAEEEKLMESNRYPNFSAHKQLHKDLIQQVQNYVARFEAGGMINVEMLEFLKSWLRDHINVQDKKYGAYLNSKGVQ